MSPCLVGCVLTILAGYLVLLLVRVPWWVSALLVAVGALGLLMPLL